MNKYVVIGAIVTVTILLSIIIRYFLTRKDEDDPPAVDPPAVDPPAVDPPPICTVYDMFEDLGLMNDISARNRDLMRTLINTVDVVVDTVSTKPVVKSVMHGMDANMDMLLHGVDREFLTTFIVMAPQCMMSDENGDANIRCFRDGFSGSGEQFAEGLARLMNTLRANVNVYGDKFVFRNDKDVEVEDIISVRDNTLRNVLEEIASFPHMTKEKVLGSLNHAPS